MPEAPGAPSNPAPPIAPAPSLQGEGWESSGGGGVACFESEDIAREADKALKESGCLTDTLRAKVKSLVTLEYWENASSLTFEQWHGKDESAILRVIRSRYETYAPIFASRLRLVSGRIDFTQWKQSSKLPIIDDAHPRAEVNRKNPKCRVVQLAVRYTKSRKGYLPQARVEVDQWLYQNKLDALNRAMLIHHEEIYLMAKELVHKSSDALRGVVAAIFSDKLSLMLEARTQRDNLARRQGVQLADTLFPGRAIQELVGWLLGDYYLYFVSDPLDRPAVAPSGPGQYHRYVAFGALLQTLRSRKVSCLAQYEVFPETPRDQRVVELMEYCSAWATDPQMLADILSDEEAFLFITRWIYDRARVMDSSENLVIWDREHPEAMTPLQHAELKKACRADIRPILLKNNLRLVDKAWRYCASLGLPTPAPLAGPN